MESFKAILLLLLITLVGFTTISTSSSYIRKWPDKVVGIYLPIHGDTEYGEWTPELFEFQQKGMNVLFFAFVRPCNMTDYPKSFIKLAATRGKNTPGAVPNDTVLIASIGGATWSGTCNPWPWLSSPSEAIKMAQHVAKWPQLYGIDGIDLDIEAGAGQSPLAPSNIQVFMRELKKLNPEMIITMPTYGSPGQPTAKAYVNATWNDKSSRGGGEGAAVALMVYNGLKVLEYPNQWINAKKDAHFPANVPSNAILLGIKGGASYDVIMTLAKATIEHDYNGPFAWMSRVKNQPKSDGVAPYWDASQYPESQKGYIDALAYMRKHSK